MSHTKAGKSDAPYRSLDGSTLGLAIGITIIGLATVLVSLFATGLHFDGEPRVDWETLVAGAAATVAAFITIRQVRAQIEQADRLAREENARENYAARAVLPAVLSALCDYCEACVATLVGLLPEDREQPKVERRPSEIPTIPEGAIPAFASAIRFADDGNAAALADILSALQIQHSRMRGMRTESLLLTISVLHRIIDAAVLYAAIASAFSYSRRHSEDIQLGRIRRADVESAIRQMKVLDREEISKMMDSWQLEESILRMSKSLEK
jgi:hypothetical protein